MTTETTTEQVNKTKRADLSLIDPRNIGILEGFNIRSIDPNSNDIVWLSESIKEHGVKNALTVRANPAYHKINNNTVPEYLVVDGHRRMTAIMRLLDEGVDIPYVPCVSKKINDEEAILRMFLQNEGEPLSILEKAEGVRRFELFGYQQNEIAKMISESPATVSKLLQVASLPKKIKNKIAAKFISPTLALQILRTSKSEEELINKFELLIHESQYIGEVEVKGRAKTAFISPDTDTAEEGMMPSADKTNAIYENTAKFGKVFEKEMPLKPKKITAKSAAKLGIIKDTPLNMAANYIDGLSSDSTGQNLSEDRIRFLKDFLKLLKNNKTKEEEIIATIDKFIEEKSY